MTKQQADNFFIEIIPLITIIIKGVKYKNSRIIKTEAAISEAYLYLIDNLHKVENQDQLQRLVINYLNKSIIWSNSKLNKLESLNNNLEFYNEEGDEKEDVSLNKAITRTIEREDTQEIETLQKINIENWYNEKQCILQIYREQEKDKVKQIIFDLFFNKKITKGVHLAKHLGVNKDYGCLYIRELKQDIKDFFELYNNNKK